MFTVPSSRATRETREKLSMSELVTTYKCADGTDFPVTWQHEGDASLSWGLNDQHWSGPLRPLDAAVWEGTPARGRADSEAGLPTPRRLRRFLVPHGFVYAENAELTDEGVDDLVSRCGGVKAVWEEHCRPRVQEACTELQVAGDTERIADLLELCDYAWATTMVAFREASFGPGSGIRTTSISERSKRPYGRP